MIKYNKKKSALEKKNKKRHDGQKDDRPRTDGRMEEGISVEEGERQKGLKSTSEKNSRWQKDVKIRCGLTGEEVRLRWLR